MREAAANADGGPQVMAQLESLLPRGWHGHGAPADGGDVLIHVGDTRQGGGGAR
jgi:hypothetical protein